MKLSFLGIGSAYHTVWFNSNAYFRIGDSLVLLDCGESSFARLMEKGLLQKLQGECYAFITHLHADHAGSLPSLCSFFAGKLHKRVRVIYPDEEIDDFLRLAGIPPTDYIHLTSLEDQLPPLQARAVPTTHIPGYPSYGWMLDDPLERVYFSGDSREIPQEILSGLLDKSISMVYHDVEYLSEEKKDGCHLQYQALLRAVPPDARERFCCMHMNCDFRERAMTDGFRVAQTDGIQ